MPACLKGWEGVGKIFRSRGGSGALDRWPPYGTRARPPNRRGQARIVFLPVGHHELRPVGRGRALAGVVADVVGDAVVVVVEVEVDAELRRPRLVDGREARGAEAAFRPVQVVDGVGEARRLNGGRRGLEVAGLQRRRAREAAARLHVDPAGAVSGKGAGAGERAAAQPQGHRKDGGAGGDQRGVEGGDGFVLLVFIVVTHPQRAGGGGGGIDRPAGVGGLARLQHPAVLGGDGGKSDLCGSRVYDLRRGAVVAAAVPPAGGAGEGGGDGMAAHRQRRGAEGGMAGAVDGDVGGQGAGPLGEGDGARGHAGAGGHGRGKRDRLPGARGIGRGAECGGGRGDGTRDPRDFTIAQLEREGADVISVGGAGGDGGNSLFVRYVQCDAGYRDAGVIDSTVLLVA